MKNKFSRTKFDRLIRKVPEKVRDELRDDLSRAADLIVKTQKAFAPVDDGTLSSTIRHEPVSEAEGKIAVRIQAGGPRTTKPVRDGQSVTYDYALGVEFGTSDTEAQPFFYPGYRATRKRVRSRVSRAVKKAVKRARDE